VKRAPRAIELRPALKARNATHRQERQHSTAEGRTRDRVRPAGAQSAALAPLGVRDRHPNGRRRALLQV
jgi:hypothetical protein